MGRRGGAVGVGCAAAGRVGQASTAAGCLLGRRSDQLLGLQRDADLGSGPKWLGLLVLRHLGAAVKEPAGRAAVRRRAGGSPFGRLAGVTWVEDDVGRAGRAMTV